MPYTNVKPHSSESVDGALEQELPRSSLTSGVQGADKAQVTGIPTS